MCYSNEPGSFGACAMQDIIEIDEGMEIAYRRDPSDPNYLVATLPTTLKIHDSCPAAKSILSCPSYPIFLLSVDPIQTS